MTQTNVSVRAELESNFGTYLKDIAEHVLKNPALQGLPSEFAEEIAAQAIAEASRSCSASECLSSYLVETAERMAAARLEGRGFGTLGPVKPIEALGHAHDRGYGPSEVPAIQASLSRRESPTLPGMAPIVGEPTDFPAAGPRAVEPARDDRCANGQRSLDPLLVQTLPTAAATVNLDPRLCGPRIAIGPTISEDFGVFALAGFPDNPRRAARLCITALADDLDLDPGPILETALDHVVNELSQLIEHASSGDGERLLPFDIAWQRVARRATLRAVMAELKDQVEARAT